MSPRETGTQAAAELSSEIQGKSVLITGVSPNGLGARFAITIAAHKPSLIILAGRSTAKLAATKEEIQKVAPEVKTKAVSLDLLDERSIRAAADEVSKYKEGLDVLVLNAGIMACPYKAIQWREGFKEELESQFAANHIGHFLLTGLLLKTLLKSKQKGRVVSVSSDGWRLGYNGKEYVPFMAYGQSKSANMLFAVALAERYGKQGLTALSLHPGVISDTSLSNNVEDFGSLLQLDKSQGNPQRKLDWSKVGITQDQGTATHVRAAFDPSLEKSNGRYLEDSEVVPLDNIRAWTRDTVEAEKLWKLSEQILGETFQ